MWTVSFNGNMSNCDNSTSSETVNNSIAFNFALNSVIWIACLIIFSLIPKLIKNYRQYDISCNIPQSKPLTDLSSLNDLQLSGESTATDTSFPEHLRQTDQFTSWFRAFLRLTDSDITEKCGADAMTYLHFQRYLIGYLFFIVFLTIVIILPVNYIGGQSSTSSSLSSTTIANVHSNLLWLHVTVSLLYLLATISLFLRFSQHLWTSNKSKTLIISNIHLVGNFDKLIENHLNKVYPSVVIQKIVPVYDTRKVLKLDEKLQLIRHMKEHCKNGLNTEASQESENVSSCFSNNDHIHNFDEAEETILSERAMEMNQLKKKPLRMVFVKIASEEEAESIYSSFHTFPKCRRHIMTSEFSTALNTKKWLVSYAPTKEDIIWQNMPISRSSKFIRTVLAVVILFFICLIVTSPALVTSYLEKINGTNSFLFVIIPSYLIKITVYLLPICVKDTVAFLKSWTKSSQQKKNMIALFMTLLFTVVILPSLGLTAFELLISVKSLTKKIQCIFTMANNVFFVNYVVLSALTGTGLELLRISELITLLYRYVTIRSVAKRRAFRKYDIVEFDFGQQYAYLLCLFSVVITYSILCPIISVFGCLYMILKYCVDRYNLYFIHKKSYVHKKVHLSAANIMALATIFPQFCILEFTLRVTSESQLPSHVFYYSLAVLVLSLSLSLIVWFYFKQQQVITLLNQQTSRCCCISQPKPATAKCKYGSIENSC